MVHGSYKGSAKKGQKEVMSSYNIPESVKRKRRIIIIPVKHKIGKGYIGMNYYAAHSLRDSGKPRMKKNEVLVWAGQSPWMKEETARHEIIELNLMGKRMSYKKAHQIAEKLQDVRELKVSVRGSKSRRAYEKTFAKI